MADPSLSVVQRGFPVRQGWGVGWRWLLGPGSGPGCREASGRWPGRLRDPAIIPEFPCSSPRRPAPRTRARWPNWTVPGRTLTQQALDQNGVQTSLVQAAVIRAVDYLETVVRRERRGSSQGLSIRVARGLYYRPSTFRSRRIEWEETVHADTGTLGLTAKHIYFAGSRKRFRVRYDKTVAFEPFSDGFGIMRDAQTAKPQTFRTGDGWFPYNLAVNLAQIQR